MENTDQEVVDTAGEQVNHADNITQIYKQLPHHLGKPNERKILAALLYPPTKDWTVCKICAETGISRENWYYHHRKPEFIQKCVQVCKDIKGRFAPKIMRSFLRNAMEGGPHGFGDTKAQIEYLQDVGILKSPEGSKGAQINLDVNVNVVQQKRVENQKTGLGRLGWKLPENTSG